MENEEKKVINFGKICYDRPGIYNNSVDIEVCLSKNKSGLPVFAAHGNIWSPLHTDIRCGGQCLDTIAKYVHDPLFEQIYKMWKLYHLNDMHAGTIEQEKALNEAYATGKLIHSGDYTATCDYLASIGLYEVYLDSDPDRPYKYGSGWLYRAIPYEDLEIIKSFFADKKSVSNVKSASKSI